MSFMLEELDSRQTPIGQLTLLRRRSPSLGETDIYEIRLAGDFLMSSVVNHSEIAMARLALSGLPPGGWDVLVGGLGLGYTARAALEFPDVRNLVVVEFLDPVIHWHVRGLVPLGSELTGDPRCTLVHADFFALFRSGEATEGLRILSREYDAVLVDIDHSPRSLLDPSHASFYTCDGMTRLTRHLRPGGVLSLWSAEPPDPEFRALLETLFARVEVHGIRFQNPMIGEQQTDYVYVCRKD